MCWKCPGDVEGDHSLLCLSGGYRNTLHNSLRDMVFRYASMANMSPKREEVCFPGRSMRADVYIPSTVKPSGETIRPVCIDFAITHYATIKGLAASADDVAKNVNRYAESVKRTKYSAQAEAAGIDFAPAVCDTLGCFCDAGLDILRRIAMQWGRRFDLQPGRSIPIFMQRINSLIIRGVAGIALVNAVPDDDAIPSSRPVDLPLLQPPTLPEEDVAVHAIAEGWPLCTQRAQATCMHQTVSRPSHLASLLDTKTKRPPQQIRSALTTRTQPPPSSGTRRPAERSSNRGF